MNPKETIISNYLRQIKASVPGTGVESVFRSATGLPESTLEKATLGFERAESGTPFRRGEVAALEAVIHKTLRPAILIQGGTFESPPEPWHHLSLYAEPLMPVISAIGRIEVEGSSIPYGGTGFLVGPNLMLTNRHVAELFIHGVGSGRRLRMIPGRAGRLENAHEHPHPHNKGLVFDVKKALMVHPHWDAALLEISFLGKPEDAPEPLKLRSWRPADADMPTQEIVSIGYPYHSNYHDAKVLEDIFGGIIGVKRLKPGMLMRVEEVVSYNRVVEALSHDASTLGGSSGSPIVDPTTGEVIALHFAGAYLTANYSVPAWELARDPRFVDAGVQFEPRPSPPTPEEPLPVWLSSWAGREDQSPAELGVPLSTTLTAPSRIEVTEFPLIDPGWFERYSDTDLQRMYQRNPEQFRALVNVSFPPDEAQELYDDVLRDASTEGIFGRPINPAYPEIIILPGILGSHLRGSAWGRSWMNALSLPFANLLGTLGLNRDGNDPNNLSPDGYVESTYAKAARTWRNQGFRVHEFSYDWRKPLANAAKRLDRLMRERRQARPEAKFSLVCHSMGGVVASIYGHDTPDWQNFVDSSIFCGCPLGGSFAIMEILTGEYPTVRKLAKVSLNTTLQEIQAMGASFPGALELLPHPELFTTATADVEMLYSRESYGDFCRPGDDWLRAARNIKAELRNSPILGRTQFIVCVDRPTSGTFIIKPNKLVGHSDSLTWGDGTVPSLSSLIKGIPAYRVSGEHSKLLADHGVLVSVPKLILGEPIPLEQVTFEQATQESATPPATETITSLETLDVKWEIEAEGVRERMRKGISNVEDLRWLLSSDPNESPAKEPSHPY